ncbi:MAG: TA system VapC family ribonuclease toxin [Bryobacteraceae bacterium]
MNTSNFLDANVWLALIWERHEHSGVARSWFKKAADEHFLFCRFTQLTVLRLLTTVSIMGRDVRTMTSAWVIWDQIVSDDRVALLAEPDDLEPEFRRQSRLATPSPKVWADAYLLVFAIAARVTLVTLDRALGSRARKPVIIT